MKTVRYTLLIKPDGKFPCKRKYLHDAKTDKQAIQMAEEYANKKNSVIYSLTKEVSEFNILISNN